MTSASVVRNRVSDSVAGVRILIKDYDVDRVVAPGFWPEDIKCRPWQKKKPRKNQDRGYKKPRPPGVSRNYHQDDEYDDHESVYSGSYSDMAQDIAGNQHRTDGYRYSRDRPYDTSDMYSCHNDMYDDDYGERDYNREADYDRSYYDQYGNY